MKVAPRRSRLSLAVLLAVASFVGCAELITYSNKSIEKGDSLAAAGRDDEAAGAYRNATQQNPRSYQAFFKLGETYQRLGREQQALQSYRAALDVMPEPNKDPELLAFREKAVEGLAQCIAKSASRDAEMEAVAAKAARSSKPLDYYVLARTYVATGDADNAIDAYEKAFLNSNSNDQAIGKSFGLFLAQVNQKPRAQTILTKTYQLKPDDAEVLEALRKLGVVPGPSLLEEGQLNRPLVPKGPIPQLELNVKDRNAPAPAPAAE